MKLNIRTALLAGGFAATLATGVLVGQALADQPHMQSALQALQTARAELNYSTANKNGHRVRALGYVNSAIAETQRGMADAGRW